MAESVIISFSQRLHVMIIEEYKFLHRVQEQVVSLRDELQWISSFLRDAEMQGKRNERVELWVSQIRDLAYDAEDALDIFILNVMWLRKRNIRWLIKYPARLITLHKLGSQIEGINKRIERISTYKSKYAIDNLDDKESLGKDVALNERRSAPNVEQDDVVGFDSQSEAVAKMLLRQEEEEEEEEDSAKVVGHVVSIVGMSGSGKSTLAHKVYNDVKFYFDSCAWIYVSQNFKSESLLQSIKMQNHEREDMGKLLVVFDAVWNITDWDDLKNHVIDKIIQSTEGIVVLLTTHSPEVAEYAKLSSTDDLYNMKQLEKDDSLMLLKKKAFPNMSSFAQELEEPAMKIVEKCAGLPLAIVLLGGLLLAKQKIIEVWNKVLQNVKWQIRQGFTTGCLELISFIYDNLPNVLKPCFLYLGLFQRNSSINCERLIQLWIAEGFIQETGEETMEDVAEDYLEDLNQRNMIQVLCRRSNGSIEKFCIHGLLREFAISKGRQDKFLDVLGTKRSPTHTMSCRLAVHLTSKMEKGTEIPESSSLNSLRSMLCFNHLSNVRLEEKSFYKSFKFLRVLDMRGVTDLRRLPYEIGKLVLLKYLNLYGTKIERLPSSIRNLQNLQTLDISETRINGIPRSVWKLEELRHFYANLKPVSHSNSSDTGNGISCNLHCKIIDAGVRAPPKIRRLRNLHTLSTAGDNWISNDFGQLINLRKLQITEVSMDLYGEALSNSILSLIYLKELDIKWKEGKLQFQDSLSNHFQLYKMRLLGVMEKLPTDPNFFPPNLTELELCHTDLKQEDGPMKSLAALKNLKLLKLHERSFLGNQMVFPAKGFPNLIYLDLAFLTDLEELKVEEGSFPNLKFLSLVSLNSLRELPDGLQKVSSLEKLYLLGMPPKFQERTEEDVGDDWPKIKHIPSIKFGSVKFAKLDLVY
ncbi:disease resistance protein RPH8A-like isoform X1 [Macadamia integrifolia]|uniref:disease resistance protein RPH8A-like isoform X1 n=1 Tax=Macadamia integrifolia TaxID=60698 RepID=UPI001C5011D9|nr:disease resistance protein RPH8A-like isoform X1 [Macadamia integrifolia]XP_042504390.1 disease resistance protein RPH8A-like isoform X1 [Macadamia integrifolia]